MERDITKPVQPETLSTDVGVNTIALVCAGLAAATRLSVEVDIPRPNGEAAQGVDFDA